MRARYRTSQSALSRRDVLALGLAAAGASVCLRAFGAGSTTAAPAQVTRKGLASVGPLGPPDANGVRVPAGFRARIVARSGQPPLAHRSFLWHEAPDGGAVFAQPDGGWIYVSNAELTGGKGGASALRFGANGDLVDAYPVLGGTTFNCAGGPTPWGTWLSCEEHPRGLVWECDPQGRVNARPWPALGAYMHEAVAIDPQAMRLYLTEDMPDGCWYRFTPSRVDRSTGRPDLSAGSLEVAQWLESGEVRWHRIADPAGGAVPTRKQVPLATPFRGGEGCCFANGKIYFTTKRDNRVWEYDVGATRLRVLYDANASPDGALRGVDNVTVASDGAVLVAEDAGDMQIVALSPDGTATPIVQIEGHSGSEVAGPGFDPSGTRLYFSSQRGAAGRNSDGVTYEVSGAF